MDTEIADQLLRHLSEARWFAGKGRRAEIGSLTPLPWLTPASQWPALRVEIVRVDYPPAEEAEPTGIDEDQVWPQELYQLIVAYHRAPVPGLQHAEIGRITVDDLGPTVAYDATQDPGAGAQIWRLLLDGADVSDRAAELVFHRAEASELDPDATPLPFTGQQSNTSVMLGDVAMIKFFRRIELGPNLDIEVHDALARAGVADVARLYGWVRAQWHQDGIPVEADLAMAVEKLADAVDGWGLALDSRRADGDFASDAAQLGHALAVIHHALADTFPTVEADGAGIETVMRQRLAAAEQVAPVLLEVGDGLAAAFARLREDALATQRVHGDFHLGQTLKTPTGWKIIDFEGEPAKTMAERVALDSPWRDVAGMLRSFDYAAATVPGPGAAHWLATAREAFLTAYAGGPLTDRDRAVLRAYEADKAVYELVYEVRNRPDWTAIPLGAIRTIGNEGDH
ncbi:MAG: phosphotransferase [Microlunatus sp.]|nr:phosphotransferase [Microlunatus sp.]